MNSDPLQSLETRLFDAARSETLPEGVEERVVLAARKRRETARTLPVRTERVAVWLLLAAAVLSAAVFVLRRKDPNVAITAEPSHRGQVEAPRPPPPPASAAVHSEPVREAPSRPSLALLPSARPAPPATLADELAALKRAESALSSGDATSALAELDRYDRVLHGKQMRAEATLLRMEAL